MRFETLRIADIRQETPDTISVALAVPEDQAPRFAFQPGQYLTLRTHVDGEELRRSYSICSGLDDQELRVAIKRVDDGRFSAWAHGGLRIGDTLEVMPPDGRFTVEPASDAARLYLGVAAGSGITPILSILKSVLTREPGSRFILLYGSRATGQIIFREQLEELKDRFMGRLAVVHVLSREQQDVPVLYGHLDGAKVRTLLSGLAAVPQIDHAFLCGPAAMIDEVQATLAEAGLAPERIHSERFTPATPAVSCLRTTPGPAAATPQATAVIIADGVRTEVPVDAQETVLEAALRAGLDLPYSCRGGMCSTCRARVTEGSVEMDVNYALEPWETAAGYVLTCQSHPTSERLTVDYDHV
jgi:ring-1,2-phenylacetyl-CoA epoxidase subunit PaaE